MATDRFRTAGRHARTTRTVRLILDWLRAMADSSRAINAYNAAYAAFRQAWAASTTESGASRTRTASGRVLGTSLVASTVADIGRPIQRTAKQAADRATVTRLAGGIESALRSSWLYRWLTAEPEPEVIVIDLRETLSVGPLLAALDRGVRILVPARHRSAVIWGAARAHRSVRVAPVRAASLVVGIAVLVNLAVTLTVGEPTEAGVLARIVAIGVAGLGTRVSLSWSELVETRPVQLLIAALEPPEPPENS